MLLTQEPALRRFWYPVAFSTAVGPGPLHRQLLGTDLVLWRAGGTVVAALDRCPHREARLSRGWVHDDRLVCPYHGWEFSTTGNLARVPQLPATSPLPPKGVLDRFRCVERYGWVWVSLDDDPIGGIPELPEWELDGWRVVPEYEWMFDCSAAHLLENNIDLSHVAIVHRESFGAGIDPLLEVPTMERTSFGLVSESRIPVAGRPGEDGKTVRVTTTEMWGPFLAVFRIGYPDGLVHIMVKACTPERDDRTRLLQTVFRNDGEADRPAADILAFDNKVETEDQDVLSGLPSEYPLDPLEQVHTKVDRPVLELRRWYTDIIAGRWAPQPVAVVGVGQD